MVEILLGLAIGLFLGLLLCQLKNELYYIGITFGIVCIAIMNRSSRSAGNSSRYYGGHLISDFPKDFFKRDDSAHGKISPAPRYSSEVLHILRTSEFPEPASHYPTKPEKSDNFNRILDLTKRMPYKRSLGEYKPQLHWGQLKLFLSEVEFLTKVVNDAKGKKITFVYAGAAPGDHTEYLSSLFPDIRFELYDPNNFVFKDSKMIKTHIQFFLEVDAQEWADYAKAHPDEYIAFCSDIRSEPATEENVARNMAMQLEWWKTINPDLTMFKFRLPWDKGQTDYPEGEIYIQLYPGATSTETRLIFKKDAKIIKYDNEAYEQALYFHNRKLRSMEYSQSSGVVLDKCYDCTGFEQIMKDYLDLGINKKSLKEIIKEVQENVSIGNKTVRTQTIRQITKELDRYYRDQYDKCDNDKCNICPAGSARAVVLSVATIENEEMERKQRVKKSDKKLDGKKSKSKKLESKKLDGKKLEDKKLEDKKFKGNKTD